jgi:hypothetical protein
VFSRNKSRIRNRPSSLDSEIELRPHAKNAIGDRKSINDGITIDFNPQCENADFSIRSNREQLSNSTDASDRQQEKLDSLKTITDDEITIDFNPQCENADFSIRSNRDPLSISTDSSDLQE